MNQQDLSQLLLLSSNSLLLSIPLLKRISPSSLPFFSVFPLFHSFCSALCLSSAHHLSQSQTNGLCYLRQSPRILLDTLLVFFSTPPPPQNSLHSLSQKTQLTLAAPPSLSKNSYQKATSWTSATCHHSIEYPPVLTKLLLPENHHYSHSLSWQLTLSSWLSEAFRKW